MLFRRLFDVNVVTMSNQHYDVALASMRRGEMMKEPYCLDPHYLVSLFCLRDVFPYKSYVKRLRRMSRILVYTGNVNGHTFRGSNTAIIIFISLLKGADSFFKGWTSFFKAMPSSKSNRKS